MGMSSYILHVSIILDLHWEVKIQSIHGVHSWDIIHKLSRLLLHLRSCWESSWRIWEVTSIYKCLGNWSWYHVGSRWHHHKYVRFFLFFFSFLQISCLPFLWSKLKRIKIIFQNFQVYFQLYVIMFCKIVQKFIYPYIYVSKWKKD